MAQITIKKIKASSGKVWKHKTSGAVLSETIYLGKNDVLENYEQINEPVEEIQESEE